MPDELSPSQRTEIQNAIFTSHKIEAIKLYREATGRDLKDSKDAVERLAEELKRQDPARFRMAEQRRVSFGTIAFWIALVALAGYLAFVGI